MLPSTICILTHFSMLQMFKRFGLFILTNILVLILIWVVMSVVQIFFPEVRTALGGNGYYLIYAAVVGFLGSFVSLFLSKWMAKSTYGIILINETNIHTVDEKLRKIYETVERISKQSNITMPEVGYYESTDPNAFATGPSKNNSLVAVSTGLMSSMTNEEIEGVIGHEMAHILNWDMVTMTLLQWVMNTFVIFISHIVAKIVTSFISKNDEEWSIGNFLIYNGIYMALQIVFGILASIVVMWFSRHREYRADEGSSRLVGKEKMIRALRKLESLTQVTNAHDDWQLAAFKISSKEAFELFSSHPALPKRISNLESQYTL